MQKVILRMARKEFTVGIDENFYISIEPELKKLGFKSKSDFFNFLTKNYFTGNTDNEELTVKQQTEKAKLDLVLEKIKIASQDLRIKTAYADNITKYLETFGTLPTAQGLRAITSKSKNQNIIKVSETQKETYNPKFAYTKTNNEWFGMCKICNDSNFSSVFEDSIISIMEEHIREEHQQNPYTVVLVK